MCKICCVGMLSTYWLGGTAGEYMQMHDGCCWAHTQEDTKGHITNITDPLELSMRLL